MSSIERLGPGIWYVLHSLAWRCSNGALEDKKRYESYVRDLCENFPCARCKRHFKKYLEEKPVERYFALKDGLFIWAWEFHNAVNRRLGKPEWEYEKARRMYSGEEDVCVSCHEEEPVIIVSHREKKKDKTIRFIFRSFE